MLVIMIIIILLYYYETVHKSERVRKGGLQVAVVIGRREAAKQDAYL